ncbi:hypothetical protein EGW08_002332 [Elysia chlorotica]|uniref:MADF domain-containing protein n=1 Tax=Elysia chlorotica TaxID=188477 RepID=A0A3S1CDP8_ELYCH|nr:hypothetical protein EGW08_002332 [Elysia chlorotica]
MDVDALISAVYHRPAIWNRMTKDHANRNLVNEAWRDISDELQHDETILRSKWKSLRDYFVVELGKRHIARTKARKGTKLPPVPRWQFFRQLLFLKDVVAHKVPADCLELEGAADSPPEYKPLIPLVVQHESGTESLNGTGSGEVDAQVPGMSNENAAGPEAPDVGSGSSHPVHDLSVAESWGKGTTVRKLLRGAKRKWQDDVEGGLRDLSDTEYRHMEYCSPRGRGRNTPTESSDDAELLFLKSLHPFLKKVPHHLRLCVRNQIQSIIEEFAFPPSATQCHRKSPHQYNNFTVHTAQGQSCQDRATPTATFQNHSRLSSPHSSVSDTTEHDIVTNTSS